MWVKICANTCLEDALAAVEFGADAVGFVFAPSRRQVNAAQVRAITDRLPGSVETVGVFAGEDAETIGDAVVEAGLNTVQLHGGVNLPLARSLRLRLGPEIAFIHSAHWALDHEIASAQRVAHAMEQTATDAAQSRLLVDARVGHASGGLGVPFDWNHARPAFARAYGLDLRLILAGGLRPDNVAQAINILRPWGVDVATGVEQEPGRKDHTLLKSFIANAKGT